MTIVRCRLILLVEGQASADEWPRFIQPGTVTPRGSSLPLFDARTAERVRIGTVHDVRLEGGAWVGEAELPADLIGQGLGAELALGSSAVDLAESDRPDVDMLVIRNADLLAASVVDEPAFPDCRIEEAPEEDHDG